MWRIEIGLCYRSWNTGSHRFYGIASVPVPEPMTGTVSLFGLVLLAQGRASRKVMIVAKKRV